MVTFCVLVFPLPYAVRKRLFRFLSESPIVAKVAYGLKISFMYVPLSFSCVCLLIFRSASSAFYSWMPFNACSALPPNWNQPARTTPFMMPAPNPTSPRGNSSTSLLRSNVPLFTRVLASRSAQRNMYLTGFCLFLSLVLTRTFSIVLDLIQTQEDYAKLKKAASVSVDFICEPV